MSIKRLQKFNKNLIGRDFIVGDIHGCYSLLMEKLNEINFDTEKDRLFSVGDLIDRGKENEDCLELIYQKWFFPVIGNHELLMLGGVFLGEYALWFKNGGNWILGDSFGGNDIEMYAKDINLLLPLAIEITDGEKTFGIVHAEPSCDWNSIRSFCDKNYDIVDLLLEKDNFGKKEMKTFKQITWGRTRFKTKHTKKIKNIDSVYVGHTITFEATDLGNVRYIDTGSYKTGNITIEQF